MAKANVPVLIVDDSDAVRTFLCDILSDEGYECISTGNPLEVPRLLMDSDCSVVILDMGLPYRDGLDVLMDIAAVERASSRRILTIVVTGSHDQHVALKALQRGAFMYINKPIQNAMLLEGIEKALGEIEKAEAPPSPPPKVVQTSPSDVKTHELSALDKALAHVRSPKGFFNAQGYEKPILLFETSPTAMKVISDLLVEAGYVVICLPDRDKLKYLIRRYQVEIVILDFDMSHEEGLPFLDELQVMQEELGRKLFLVLLTGIQDQQAALLYRRRGASANVPKKEAPQKLLGVIERAVLFKDA